MADVPKRFPLVAAPENRDSTTTKDAKLVNGYMEKTSKDGYRLFKRPGTLLNTQPSGASGNGYGVYNWKGNIYSVVGTTLYKDLVSKGTVDATGGVYRFSLSSGATPRLVLGNGVKAYTYEDGGGLAQITDVDFPTSFYKGWAYLDKTTYVMRTPNNIQGSDLDNPTSWDPLNLVNAQVEADLGVGLDKQLVYVIAFKQWSTETFYDAANSTGSPLSPSQATKLPWGCASIETVQTVDDSIFWIATNRGSSVQVLGMSNLKPGVISTPAVERLLDGIDFTGTIYSWAFKHAGHYFYGITSTAANLTLVYDTHEKMWAQWTDTSGNYWPIVSMTYSSGLGHLGQHETNGKIYLLDTAYNNDDGSLFTVDVVTPNFDGGVRNRKYLPRIEFIADQQPGSILQVRKSDDDYQTWSNFRSVDLGKKRPYMVNCGSFNRRAYNLRHRSNTPLRLEAMEMALELGTI